MRDKIQALKEHVREVSANPDFVHREWFVEYHLKLVERIALELLPHYPQADPDVVMVMVWMHDYGKILDFDNQYAMTSAAGPGALTRLGFDAEFAGKVIANIELLDRKMDEDLHEAPIEVQIVSSADGASHHVGPFMPVYWRENAGKTIADLMASQQAKTLKDWGRKMVLPEVRAAFEWRHRAAMEQAGVLPEKFLKVI